ncbi:MAG: hypothetical protein IJE05_05475 [Clostridia bacterium]|nr:hypothetical protein [Clostridia bacterium]MBQ6995982.1 hypothetical protein [Lachnospiraceae bacterium]
MTAKKILLVGNGFDLAHSLLTGYGDFLYIMKNWDEFYKTFLHVRQSWDISPKKEFGKYLVNAHDMNDDNLMILGDIIKENSWVHYYCNCEAEIDGWIDFERELYPVMDLFAEVFAAEYSMQEVDYIALGKGASIKVSANARRVGKLFEKYIVVRDNYFIVKASFVSKQYGILKKKMLQTLKEEFDEFIKAFEIYLLEFVHKKKDIKTLKQIKNINADRVISFNYTLTEKIYGISEENTHHLHGKIRENINDSQNHNDMVLGASERTEQNLDFIYFIKYFQRIQKRIGTKYKDFLDVVTDERGDIYSYDLHIYGHSLDKTDEDVLKTVMGYARQIFIYYYNQEDYERKVINLIDLYGRDEVEENIEDYRFQFVQTFGETV